MAARDSYQASSGDTGQRECARRDWCAASTRDAEGVWHPALTYQAFCPACTSRIITCITELPPLYGQIAAMSADPFRTGRSAVRAAPGPRVLVSVAADTLLRETAPLIAGWAARVRAVPGLLLSAPVHPPGSPLRVREDCRVLALHAIPLLALAGGWTSRTYEIPGSVPPPLDRHRASCRKCGRLITRSPVSGWWWAPDGQPTVFCDHDPGPGSITRPRERPLPEPAQKLLDDIAGEEIVRAGDGWVTVLRRRDGTQAGTEILDLHWRASRLSGQVPAPAEILDGIPCRECEELGALAVLEQPPPDPEKPEPPYVRCTGCQLEMTRTETGAWAKMYEAWAKGAGILICRRCELDKHGDCFWDSCGCPGPGHRTGNAAA